MKAEDKRALKAVLMGFAPVIAIIFGLIYKEMVGFETAVIVILSVIVFLLIRLLYTIPNTLTNREKTTTEKPQC